VKNMKRLNEKDWLKITAYLDGDLSSNDKSVFEERIRQEPELMEALEKVKWTKTLLKNAPRRAVPHQFKLTRQMANEVEKKSRWNVWRYGTVSGIASIVFLVLAGIQFLPMMGMSGNLAMAPKEMIQEEVAFMEAPMVMEEAAVEPEAMEMQADTAADFAAEEIIEEAEPAEMMEMEMAEAAEEPMTAEFSEEDAEKEAGEPSGGGALPTMMPTAVKELDSEEIEIEEVAPRVDETFAMSEAEELNDDLAGYAEDEQDFEAYEFVAEEPFVEGISNQNVLLIGGMILSALIAILALLAAFRNRNRI